MTRALEGKVAVVTGSGRGVGREIALSMAAQGAKVVVNDLGVSADGTGESEPVADAVVREIKAGGGEAVANGDSVAEAKGAERIVDTAIDTFGKIDVLVNNAGILRDRMIWNMADEEWDLVMKVHLYGHFYCTRAAVRWMREAIPAGTQANGRIINFTSHSGIRGNPGQPNYAAAKAGVIGFTYSTALACERFGVTCNAIAPRALTRMTDSIPDDRLRALAKQRGMPGWDAPNIADVKRAFIGGPPEGVAPLAVWLASDASQHVTGEVFMATEGVVALFSRMAEVKYAYNNGPHTQPDLSRAMQAILPRT
ncbi:MAG: SDR family oxidoreductase [Candidatus Binatia bacterium]